MVRKVQTEVTPAGLATKYLLAQQVRALLMLLNLQRVKEARFRHSEQVSGWKFVQGLTVLVLVTVLLCVTGRRRCILPVAVATALRRSISHRGNASSSDDWSGGEHESSINDP